MASWLKKQASEKAHACEIASYIISSVAVR